MQRHSGLAQQHATAVTSDDVASIGANEGAFDTLVPPLTVLFSLRECAELAPLLKYAMDQGRRNGLHVSLPQKLADRAHCLRREAPQRTGNACHYVPSGPHARCPRVEGAFLPCPRTAERPAGRTNLVDRA